MNCKGTVGTPYDKTYSQNNRPILCICEIKEYFMYIVVLFMTPGKMDQWMIILNDLHNNIALW